MDKPIAKITIGGVIAILAVAVTMLFMDCKQLRHRCDCLMRLLHEVNEDNPQYFLDSIVVGSESYAEYLSTFDFYKHKVCNEL